MEKAFLHMTSLTKVERLKHLWMAPFTLHPKLAAFAGPRSQSGAAGKPARGLRK